MKFFCLLSQKSKGEKTKTIRKWLNVWIKYSLPLFSYLFFFFLGEKGIDIFKQVEVKYKTI